MKKIDKYAILGIETKEFLPSKNQKITDEMIKKQYLRIKNFLENKYRESIISEHKKEEIDKILERFNILHDAYLSLETKKKRDFYEYPYLKKKLFKQKFKKLITKGNHSNIIQIKRFNLGNKASSVNNDAHYIQYLPEYEDDKVLILGLEKIDFNNGLQGKDSIIKHNLFIKAENEDVMTESAEFYSNIDFGKMKNLEYREVLYKALYKGICDNENYIGNVTNDGKNGLVVVFDEGQFDAIFQYEKGILKKNMKSNFIKKGEDR